ncbi:hypothetical protein ACQJBY_060258 [Aegilops geniculata]
MGAASLLSSANTAPFIFNPPTSPTSPVHPTSSPLPTQRQAQTQLRRDNQTTGCLILLFVGGFCAPRRALARILQWRPRRARRRWTRGSGSGRGQPGESPQRPPARGRRRSLPSGGRGASTRSTRPSSSRRSALSEAGHRPRRRRRRVAGPCGRRPTARSRWRLAGARAGAAPYSPPAAAACRPPTARASAPQPRRPRATPPSLPPHSRSRGRYRRWRKRPRCSAGWFPAATSCRSRRCSARPPTTSRRWRCRCAP